MLKPSLNLRAKELAKRSSANLPSILRGTKLRPALPLAYPQANLGLSADHPSQTLRRTVTGELRQSNRTIPEIQNDLIATGLFESVNVYLRPNQSLSFSALDQLSNPSGMSDPSRKQWSLPIVKAEQAWALTLGRTNIGSIDGGGQTTHPDWAPNLLAQSSAYAEPNSANFTFIEEWQPDSLGVNLQFPFDESNPGKTSKDSQNLKSPETARFWGTTSDDNGR